MFLKLKFEIKKRYLTNFKKFEIEKILNGLDIEFLH